MGLNLPNETVIEYLRKYQSLPSLTIARMLVNECPNAFNNVEYARRLVRYYRGAAGSGNRHNLKVENYVPRILVEPSDSFDYSPHILPEDAYPILCLGDVHLPYHDQDALEIAVEYGINTAVKTVLIAGDFMDCYQLSRFVRDPRLRDMKEELKLAAATIYQISKALPKSRIIYKYGNHEERWEQYLMQHAPELYGLEAIKLESVLELSDMGVTVVTDKRIIRAGHLNIIHGHEYIYSISNPVNPARGLYNRAHKSALCFHHHQTSEHTEPSINGDIVTCWSAGCLCDLHPRYMPLNKWNLGFAVIRKTDGMFLVDNKRIVNYKVL